MSELLIDHPVVSDNYFFPRRLTLKDFPEKDFGRLHFIPTPDGIDLTAYQYAPHPKAGTLFHFHGNGEVIADYLDGFHGEIEKIGLNSFFVEYRGYGLSGGEPSLSKLLEDVPTVLAYLSERAGVPPDRTVIMGRSIGSLFAVEAAVRLKNKFAGLILESGIADLTERLLLRVEPEEIGGDPDRFYEEVDRYFNQQEKMGSIDRPLLILHTVHDGLVDPSHAQSLYEWCASPRKRIEFFDRGNHNTIFYENTREYFSLMGEFARSL
jgi:alpha-beta hydrolase superfamily lysophospholipase